MDTLALVINGTPILAPKEIPDGGTTLLNGILANGTTIVLIVAAILAGFVLIRGGLMWALSGGDKQKIAQARSYIIYAIIGLVLIFLSFLIINFLFYIFGLM